MRKTLTPRLRAVDLTYSALFAVLIAVGAWVSVPLPKPFVPFTMQTFAVFAAVMCLGGRRGLYAVTVYLLLGAVGAPMFTGFRGGAGVLLDVTGGYLIGFLALALVYWALTAAFGGAAHVKPGAAASAKSGAAHVKPGAAASAKSGAAHVKPGAALPVQIGACVAGLIACYAFGTAWFVALYASAKGPVGVMTALGWCVFPYLLPDAVKLCLAAAFSRRLARVMK